MTRSMDCRLDRHRWSDRGAAAVEFALVASLLILLLFGMLQFGYSFWESIQVAQGAREGVRTASVYVTQLERTAALPAKVRDSVLAAAPGLRPERLVVTVPVALETSQSISVVVTYPRTQFFPIYMEGQGLFLSADIVSTAAMRKEQ